MNTSAARFAVLLACVLVSSCGETGEKSSSAPAESDDELFRAGSIVIRQADLEYHLAENFAGNTAETARKTALDQLVRRARFAQAAIDAKLDQDPWFRAEMERLLGARLRETALFPQIQGAMAAVTEDRLLEIYAAQEVRFHSAEKRQVAVLWLDPGQDPARVKLYEEKLTRARAWFADRGDSVEPPDKGFSVLAIDHSEHAATRFKGGVLGWLEGEGNATTDWHRVVAEIAFELDTIGDLSPVVTRSEGIFLVRLMDLEPAVQRSFESVRAELEREERNRLQEELEAAFEADIAAKYP